MESPSTFQPMGEKAVFSSVLKLLASDHDNEYMMIDATYALINTAPVREKKRPASDRQIARRIDHQSARARRCLG
jgi:hypothetical protein